MESHKREVIGSYLTEVLLAIALYIFCILAFGTSELSKFVYQTSGTWATIFGVVVAADLAALALWPKVASAFFGWLRWRGALAKYSTSFKVSLSTHFLLLLLMVVSTYSTNRVLQLVTLFFLLYGMINIYSVYKVTTGLLELRSAFGDAMRQANSSTRAPGRNKPRRRKKKK